MKRILIISLTVLLVLLIGTGTYIYTVINRMLNQIEETDGLVDEQGVPVTTHEDKGISPEAPNQEETGIVNILLIGMDRRLKTDAAHSDSMMIASIDKKKKTIKITSLMRDMYVPIPGKKDNRINTSFMWGGPALAVKTVNTNFNMNIEDYVAVDFYSLEEVIELVGGVPIEIKSKEIKRINEYIYEVNTLSGDPPSKDYITEPGLQTLNGRQAVAYCRVRHVGRDDFERTERQRRVLNELFKKGKSLGIAKAPELISTILKHVETSLDRSKILDLSLAMLGFNLPELEQFRIPADDAYTDEWVSDDMLVLKPDIEKNTKLLHEFIYGKKDEPDETETNRDTQNQDSQVADDSGDAEVE
jgi:LCP family protein required for cell wall assembly